MSRSGSYDRNVRNERSIAVHPTGWCQRKSLLRDPARNGNAHFSASTQACQSNDFVATHRELKRAQRCDSACSGWDQRRRRASAEARRPIGYRRPSHRPKR